MRITSKKVVRSFNRKSKRAEIKSVKVTRSLKSSIVDSIELVVGKAIEFKDYVVTKFSKLKTKFSKMFTKKGIAV